MESSQESKLNIEIYGDVSWWTVVPEMFIFELNWDQQQEGQLWHVVQESKIDNS